MFHFDDLGGAGRAARGDQVSERVRPGSGRPGGWRPGGGRLRAVEEDQRRCFGGQDGGTLRHGDESGRVAARQYPRQPPRRCRDVQRQESRADLEDSELRDDEVGPAVKEYRHGTLGTGAERNQPGRETSALAASSV